MHLISVDGVCQLYSVIDASVPGNIALCARFQFGTKRKDKREVNHLVPQELIHFLAGEIGGGCLRCGGVEPSRTVSQSGHQREPCPPLGRGLGDREKLFSELEIGGGGGGILERETLF